MFIYHIRAPVWSPFLGTRRRSAEPASRAQRAEIPPSTGITVPVR